MEFEKHLANSFKITKINLIFLIIFPRREPVRRKKVVCSRPFGSIPDQIPFRNDFVNNCS